MEMIFSKLEDNIFEFERFELCLSGEQEHYINSDNGYFAFKDLSEFVKVKDGYRIVDEDNMFEILTIEEYNEIEKLYNEFVLNIKDNGETW